MRPCRAPPLFPRQWFSGVNALPDDLNIDMLLGRSPEGLSEKKTAVSCGECGWHVLPVIP